MFFLCGEFDIGVKYLLRDFTKTDLMVVVLGMAISFRREIS